AIRKHTSKVLDVHLMIANPDHYLADFCKAGANILTVHYEACTHLHRTISEIKRLGMKAGVALNPHTPIDVLEEIISELDLVLNNRVFLQPKDPTVHFDTNISLRYMYMRYHLYVLQAKTLG
ncbi:hypothetical protein EBU71_22265, partial [bacterium]|nr:hypothetical protein [Candidatus Elulimicrobium humile]